MPPVSGKLDMCFFCVPNQASMQVSWNLCPQHRATVGPYVGSSKLSVQIGQSFCPSNIFDGGGCVLTQSALNKTPWFLCDLLSPAGVLLDPLQPWRWTDDFLIHPLPICSNELISYSVEISNHFLV
jgi:hypothetical protein